jgi:membrane protease YdiL (CAAX protease family)
VVLVTLLCIRTEFLYRGFLLFGIQKEYGPYAGVLVQVIPYVLAHAGKAELEALGSLPVGLALGYLAVRTGSIWYGAVLHGSIALLFNALILFRHFHHY